ncbi:hypothetical protein Pint_04560 [Pistacia integerrima]|uniref:Uncharacterized protein n=1 Tax=Pistacia integerrima TaxID=434235 RepID=A0ACC0Z355_9ROSI|nr:hypothetical protein Pint_04560 [Pistacia integerrima]
MDLEIAIAVITNTHVRVFMVLQLFHVKKHPDVIPFISLFMLLILTLGHMFPLMLKFEALFLQNRKQKTVVLGSGGWLEVNEVLVRIITMIAFLLEVCLLQLSWSSRWIGANQMGLSIAEKSLLFMSLPLSVARALILSLVNWSKHSHNQLLGGQCIIPQKFREGEGYEEVPVVSESQLPKKSGRTTSTRLGPIFANVTVENFESPAS